MAPDTVAQVCEPFAQSARAIASKKSGPGIGVAVVHKLVEGLGGTVVAKSAGIGQLRRRAASPRA
jgi:signal transduction histidine kinase